MKKVLFLITKSNWGGAQRYVYEVATAAKAAGHNVVVVVGGDGLLVHKLRDAGIPVFPLTELRQKRAVLADLFAFGSLFTLMRLMRAERPQVVHVNSAKAGGLGALAARIMGIPRIIFTAHGWEFKGDRSTPAKMGIRFFSWMTLLLAHHTIAVSEAIASAVRHWPGVGKRVVVIRNGIDAFPLLPRIEARAELVGLHPGLAEAFGTPGAFVLGSVTELIPIKGLIYGIRALATLAPELRERVYWVIIGEGSLRASLIAEIRKHNLEQHIFLIGFVPEARKRLAAFDAFLFPSLYEGLAYAVLEAGVASLPVIASRTGGIPEVVEDGIGGLLTPPRDSKSITRAIATLFADEPMRIRLGSALHAAVREKFSKEKMLAATLETYGR